MSLSIEQEHRSKGQLMDSGAGLCRVDAEWLRLGVVIQNFLEEVTG